MANNLRERAQEKNRQLRENIEKNNETAVTDVISMYNSNVTPGKNTGSVEENKEESSKLRRKKKVYRRINITMDEEIAEMISIPAALHGGKTSRYIEDIVRKDLEKNLEKYKLIVKMREELD